MIKFPTSSCVYCLILSVYWNVNVDLMIFVDTMINGVNES